MSRFDKIVYVEVDDNNENKIFQMPYKEFLQEFINEEGFGSSPPYLDKKVMVDLDESEEYYNVIEWIDEEPVIRFSDKDKKYDGYTIDEELYKVLEEKYHETNDPKIYFSYDEVKEKCNYMFHFPIEAF